MTLWYNGLIGLVSGGIVGVLGYAQSGQDFDLRFFLKTVVPAAVVGVCTGFGYSPESALGMLGVGGASVGVTDAVKKVYNLLARSLSKKK